MPIRKSGFEEKLSPDKIFEALKKLESEEQILAGLYFYESLSVEEISIIVQKGRKEVHASLNDIFVKISGAPLQAERTPILSSELIR